MAASCLVTARGPALLSAQKGRQLGEVCRHAAGLVLGEQLGFALAEPPQPGNNSWGRVKLRHRRHKKEPQAVYALGALLSLLPHFRLLSWAAGCRGMGAAQPGLMNGI